MVSNGESFSISRTTQLFDEDEWELMDDSYSSFRNPKSPTSLRPSGGDSLACPTPSPFLPNRDNYQTHGIVHMSEPIAPSPFHGHIMFSSPPLPTKDKDLYLHTQYRIDDPVCPGRVHGGRAGASRAVARSDMQDSAICSPLLPTGNCAGAGTPPIPTWGCKSGTGTGTEPSSIEILHTGERTVSRALFPSPNEEKLQLISPSCHTSSDSGVKSSELYRPPVRQKTHDRRAEGTSDKLLISPIAYSSVEVAKVPERNSGHLLQRQPCQNSESILKRKAIDAEQRHIQWPEMTEHLRALGSLEFFTIFHLLVTLKGKPLEELWKVKEIRGLKEIPQSDVKSFIAHSDAQHKNLNLETKDIFGKRKAETEKQRYDCFVKCKDRPIFIFKISEQGEAPTALQRCFGLDKVLRVFFEGQRSKDLYRKILREGIIVGLRHYQYWTHKDTGKDFEKKEIDGEFWSSTHCYFICTSSQAESDSRSPHFKSFQTIAAARCHMMHIHMTPNVAKYISRLQLALSKTQPVDLNLSTVTVQLDDDIYCRDEAGLQTVSTDGTGYISVDLAKEIAVSLKKGMKKNQLNSNEEFPSIIQIRLFYKGAANKGTLLANNKLGPRTIVLRKSMQKVERDLNLADVPSFDSLEICGTSIQPRTAKLSRDLILLLTLGGVPGSFFMDLQDDALQKVHRIMHDRRAALDSIQGWDNEMADMARRMILSGMPLKEPHLQKSLMELRKDLLQDFRKGRILLPDSAYLYGTADPTGTLKPDQVAITLEHGLVYWPKVAVYKSPGKHPGDIHIFEVIANKQLQDIVGTGKYVVFFSTQGSRSIPDEIANSDLDGDKYLICWNAKLLSNFKENTTCWFPRAVKSHDRPLPRPKDLSTQDLEECLIDKFIDARFNPSCEVGTVSNWWLEHMDQHLSFKESNPERSEMHYNQALLLIDYFYELVDSEKTGMKVDYPKSLKPRKVPHFQEKNKPNPQNCGYGVYVNLDEDDTEYKSSTILGQIYDKALIAEESWRLDEIELESAFNITNWSNIPFADLYRRWEKYFTIYNADMKKFMSKASSNTPPAAGGSRASSITLRYRRLLYGAESLNKSSRNVNEIYANASAIYAVVYSAAKSKLARKRVSGDRAPSLYFAWSVAGPALCKMYKLHYQKIRGEEDIELSSGVFQELFCKWPASDVTEDVGSPLKEDSGI